jgi:hypothetical protein
VWGNDDLPPLFGYTQVFVHPPYSIRIPRFELQQLFLETNEAVLEGPPDTAEIWSWPDDWSEYFYEGQDLGGSALWTVRLDDRRFVAVGDSASD